MKTMYDEIEAMILSGNQRMVQREELIKSAILKADEVYSVMKKPSLILKKPGKKKPKQRAGADILTCKNCGIGIKPNDIFCEGCGKKVEKANLPWADNIEIPLICSCGKPWREGTLFCGACGAKRPVVEISSWICPKGHINTPDSIFCFVCGEKIDNVYMPNKTSY